MKEENIYYDGSDLMSMTDANGNKPEIYICVGNRTAGKTVFFNSYVFKKILKKKIRKFIWLVRYKYELNDTVEQFFNPISFLFPDKIVTGGTVYDRGYSEILMDGKTIGYGLSLKFYDKIKKVSNLFNDVDLMLWDEFQSENNQYLPNEIEALLSIHQSVSRGHGEMSRYVPLICVGNAISLLAPLYSVTDISGRIQDDTKFLRGDGYVLEQTYNKHAAEAQNQSIFNKALHANPENGIIYKENKDNIKKLKGNSVYLCSFSYKGEEFAIRRFNNGFYFCNRKVDKTFRKKFTSEEPGLMWTIPPTVTTYRRVYEQGKFMFSDLKCREALVDFIHY